MFTARTTPPVEPDRPASGVAPAARLFSCRPASASVLIFCHVNFCSALRTLTAFSSVSLRSFSKSSGLVPGGIRNDAFRISPSCFSCSGVNFNWSRTSFFRMDINRLEVSSRIRPMRSGRSPPLRPRPCDHAFSAKRPPISTNKPSVTPCFRVSHKVRMPSPLSSSAFESQSATSLFNIRLKIVETSGSSIWSLQSMLQGATSLNKVKVCSDWPDLKILSAEFRFDSCFSGSVLTGCDLCIPDFDSGVSSRIIRAMRVASHKVSGCDRVKTLVDLCANPRIPVIRVPAYDPFRPERPLGLSLFFRKVRQLR